MKIPLHRSLRRRRPAPLLLVFVALLATSAPHRGAAQALRFDDPETDYLRLLQIADLVDPGYSFTTGLLPYPDEFEASLEDAGHPWRGRAWTPGRKLLEGEVVAGIFDPRLRGFANSAAPHGQNDGPIWQGKGLTTAVDVGIFARWRGIRAQLRPVWFRAENDDFASVPPPENASNPFVNPWYHRSLDLPQRFGDDSYSRLDAGESFIQVELGPATLEAGTRSLWWGPARKNPVVMSNNAGGFPHLAAATNGPLGIGIGTLEAEWVFGTLQQSEWASDDIDREDRHLTGLAMTYAPKWLPGLSLGGTRVFVSPTPEDGIDPGDIFLVFQTPLKGSLEPDSTGNRNDEENQLGSVFARWVLPDSGFELFVEWARDDHASDFRDFLMEPEHTQAYTLGLQKVYSSSERRWTRIWFELTHLERDATREYRPSGALYTHSRVRQGYTQRGQILGAGLGPGGNAAAIGVDLFFPWGRFGVAAAREARFNDVEKGKRNEFGVICCRNIHLPVDANLLIRRNDLEMEFGLGRKRELSPLRENTGDRTNWRASFSVRWRLADDRR